MRRTRDVLWGGGLLVGTLLAGLALLPLTACNLMGGTASGGHGAEGATASAVRDPVLQDIPKPAGFMLVDDRTFGVFSGQDRIARCVYSGTTERTAVKRFYEEYMPSAGFELREWTVDEGRFDLRFESGAEVCNVLVYRGSGRNTTLVVQIKPKPKGSTQHDTQPPMRRP